MNKEKKTYEDYIREYQQRYPIYSRFSQKTHDLLRELIEHEEIKIHIIECRPKDVSSFSEKIRRPGKSYNNPLVELSDLAGVRVIVYYQDDISRIGEIINREFHVYGNESEDKKGRMHPNEFGYLSVHYAVSLKEPRASLPEWREFKEFKAEIQVRTVLQHAWAAISHALQYKSKHDIPQTMTRKLFRLAGLFELADEQFLEIRNESLQIAEMVSSEIQKGHKGIKIDAITLREFIQNSKLLAKLVELTKKIGYRYDTEELDIDIDKEKDEEKAISIIANECARLGIQTIDDLVSILETPLPIQESFLKMAKGKQDWWVSPSFLLFLLLIWAYAEKFSPQYLVDELEWGDEIAERTILAALAAKKSTGL
jgi:ppGpp synthetase/RelA/SpoT-type nucleotidyltranferase